MGHYDDLYAEEDKAHRERQKVIQKNCEHYYQPIRMSAKGKVREILCTKCKKHVEL